MKNTALLITSLCVVALVTACGSPNEPKSFVDQYLKAVKEGDKASQAKMRCIQDLPETNFGIDRVQDWEITGSKDGHEDNDLDQPFTLVIARIQYNSTSGLNIKETVGIKVFQTEDYRNFIASVSDGIYQQEVELRRQEAEIKSLSTGETVEPLPVEKPSIKSNFAETTLCVQRIMKP